MSPTPDAWPADLQEDERDRRSGPKYSVFICDLSPKERVPLEAAMTEALDLEEDRAQIVDVGPSDGGSGRFITFGTTKELPRSAAVVV